MGSCQRSGGRERRSPEPGVRVNPVSFKKNKELGMARQGAHTFNPSIGRQDLEFKASQAYRMSSRIVRPILKKERKGRKE